MFKKIKEYRQKRILAKKRRFKEEMCERAKRSGFCKKECDHCAWGKLIY